MITSHFTVKNGGCRTYRIRPFGDIQFGSKGFDNFLWERYVKEVVEDEDGFTIGMGDYTDLFRPTIRGRLRGIVCDDDDASENFDDLHRKHMEIVAKKLVPVVKAGRGCLGLVDGHHFYTYSDTRMTSTQYLCNMLQADTGKKVPYLGEMSAFIAMKFLHSKTGNTNLVIHTQHGEGGAQYIGTDMAKLERRTAPSFQADLYLRGHSTKLYAGGHDILMPSPKGSGVIHRSVLLVNTGGFMRAYDGLRASYVEKKMMPPARLGWATVHIKFVANRGYRFFDLSATV